MIVWVRHGETAANAAGVLLGRHDPPLTERGRAQVHAVAELVQREAPVRILTSPLQRARETAGIIAAACGGAPVELDDRAVELDYGAWDGKRIDELPPAEVERWRRDAEFRPPGGESLSDVGLRVAGLCRELAANEANVAVVSHVSPIKAAVCWAVGIDHAAAWRMYVALASVTRIGIRAGLPYLAAFNEVRSGAEARPA